MYRCRSRSVGLAAAMATVGHLGFVLVFFFCALALNPPTEIPTLQAHFLVGPVGVAIAAGIPTPGAIGGGEFIFGTLYDLLGFAFAAGVLGSLMKRCIDWVLGLAGYLVYLRMKPGTASGKAKERICDFALPQAVDVTSPD